MSSAFNPTLHPTVCEFLKKGGTGEYLEKIASWPPHGDGFPDILEKNLSLTRHLFIDDQVFCNHLTSADRNLVMPRLSEIWLAAHLLRNGYDLERVPEGRRGLGKTPDFRTGNGGSYTNVEVKRLSVYADRYSLPTVTDVVAMSYNPLNDEFKRKLSNAIREARGQLHHQTTSDKDSPRRMLAWDVGESLDCQMLCALESDDKIIQWLQNELSNEQRKEFDHIFLFAMGVNKAEIYFPRWITLLNA